MKVLFKLCGNCTRLAKQSPTGWIVDHHYCTCIFLEVADEKA